MRILAYSEQFIQALSNSAIFSHVQAYWGALRHIETYSSTFKCIHLWVEISIQNIALRVPRRKNSKMFPCRTLFYCVFDEMFINLPKFYKSPTSHRDWAPALIHYFCKMLHLKCLTMSWICLCLSNCSVICTVTLCYVLHQVHSEFWQNLIIFGVVRTYSRILRH